MPIPWLAVSTVVSIGKLLWRPKPKQEVQEMEGVKGILQSKTVWGIAVMVIAQVLKRNGVEVDEAGLLNDLMSAVGTILAIYGRVTASSTIAPKPIVKQ